MFGRIQGRPTPVLAVAAVLSAAFALASCGDDAGDDGQGNAKKKGIEYSEASEQPRLFAERFVKMLETTTAKDDCARLEQINLRSFTRFSCPADKDLRRRLGSFELVGVAEYGTAAVVDYTMEDAEDGAAILLFVAPDRNWGISRFGVVTEPSTKTDDDDARAGYDKAVDEYLTAVRERDCAAVKRMSLIGDPGGGELTCKEVLASVKELSERLAANADAEPRYQGGNARYGFYTLETQKPKPVNETISIVKATDPDASVEHVVLDVTPSPTAAEQRSVRQQLRLQQRLEQSERSGMAPSKNKPSEPAVKP